MCALILQLENVLDAAQLQVASELLKDGQFKSGKGSAGKVAVEVKKNLELDPQSKVYRPLSNLVMGALFRHPAYLYGALPLHVSAPIFSKYNVGDGYGRHLDDPVMGVERKFRTDLALTLFLNAPEQYEGGELLIETELGEQSIKAEQGSVVIYPAGYLHQVTKVTKGTRLVMIVWIQSLVANSEQRALLYELHQAKEEVDKSKAENLYERLNTSYNKLLRMWSAF